MFLDSVFFIKLIIYYILLITRWVLSEIFENMWHKKKAIPKVCKMLFLVRKFHFLLLNLLLLDAFFYGAHAMLHFNLFNPNINYLMSILNMVLISWDMSRLLTVCLKVDKVDLSFLLMKKYNAKAAQKDLTNSFDNSEILSLKKPENKLKFTKKTQMVVDDIGTLNRMKQNLILINFAIAELNYGRQKL